MISGSRKTGSIAAKEEGTKEVERGAAGIRLRRRKSDKRQEFSDAKLRLFCTYERIAGIIDR